MLCVFDLMRNLRHPISEMTAYPGKRLRIPQSTCKLSPLELLLILGSDHRKIDLQGVALTTTSSLARRAFTPLALGRKSPLSRLILIPYSELPGAVYPGNTLKIR